MRRERRERFLRPERLQAVFRRLAEQHERAQRHPAVYGVGRRTAPRGAPRQHMAARHRFEQHLIPIQDMRAGMLLPKARLRRLAHAGRPQEGHTLPLVLHERGVQQRPAPPCEIGIKAGEKQLHHTGNPALRVFNREFPPICRGRHAHLREFLAAEQRGARAAQKAHAVARLKQLCPREEPHPDVRFLRLLRACKVLKQRQSLLPILIHAHRHRCNPIIPCHSMFLPDFLVFFSFGLCYNLYQSSPAGGEDLFPAGAPDVFRKILSSYLFFIHFAITAAQKTAPQRKRSGVI